MEKYSVFPFSASCFLETQQWHHLTYEITFKSLNYYGLEIEHSNEHLKVFLTSLVIVIFDDLYLQMWHAYFHSSLHLIHLFLEENISHLKSSHLCLWVIAGFWKIRYLVEFFILRHFENQNCSYSPITFDLRSIGWNSYLHHQTIEHLLFQQIKELVNDPICSCLNYVDLFYSSLKLLEILGQQLIPYHLSLYFSYLNIWVCPMSFDFTLVSFLE